MEASIVIATRNRRKLLDLTLTSLAQEVRRSNRIEIVIVDHDSTDGTDLLCARHARSLPLHRLTLPFAHESVAAPKNAGLAVAKGRVVIFVDAGMICAPDFIRRHLEAHASTSETHTVAGAIFGWDEEDQTQPFWQTLVAASPPANPPAHLIDPRPQHWQANSDTPWMLAWGANLSVLRASILDAGGFDAGMCGWGWDDLELAYRLHRRGNRIAYSPTAYAYHYPHPRSPLGARLESARSNWLYTYNKHRDPGLETWEAADYWDHGAVQRRLRDLAGLHSSLQRPVPPRLRDDDGLRLLYGFVPGGSLDPDDMSMVSPSWTSVPDGGQVIRTFGLRTWLPDKSVSVADVSPTLIAYDWQPSKARPNAAQAVLCELDRVAMRIRVACRLTTDRLAVLRLRQLAREANITLDVRSA